MKYDDDQGGMEADAPSSAQCNSQEDEAGMGGDPLAVRLGEYHADDMLTKHGMTVLFECNVRTVQRMVDRYELPPSVQVGGRSFWIAGRLKSWIAAIAELREAEALKRAKRLNIFRA